MVIVVVDDWGVPGSDSVSRYGGVSRHDGGFAGSAQRVLVGVLIVIDAESSYDGHSSWRPNYYLRTSTVVEHNRHDQRASY